MLCLFQRMHEGHSDILQVRFRPKEIDRYSRFVQARRKFANYLPARVAGQMESSLGSRHLFTSGLYIESLAYQRPAGIRPSRRWGFKFEYQRDPYLDRPIRQ